MRFTLKELSRFNGKGGMPAYFAFEGKVYDVSGSALWRNGNHQVVHEAGRDLTEEIERAPHGKEMLERFPVVGELVGFEEIEHTADVGIKAYGRSLDGLFESCAYGMFSVMLEDYGRFSEKGSRAFALEADTIEDLLVDWLEELLFLFETETLVFSGFRVSIDGTRLRAEASFDFYESEHYGYAALIKAVTYHNLRIRKEKDFYAVEVIFDV